MGKKWDQGTFCWIENATNDQEKAKKFYTELFGWTAKDTPMPGEMPGHYTEFSVGDKKVAGLYAMTDEMKSGGVPPNWGSYISVDNVDDCFKALSDAGATTVMEPMDVPDTGRMALVIDPAGAAVGIWQNDSAHAGFDDLELAAGSCAWNELVTKDVDKAGSFYANVFGWRPETQEMFEGMSYTTFWNGERRAGGLVAPKMEVPSHWLVYLSVDDPDACAKKVKSLGGSIFVEPTDIPEVGRFAVCSDDQGSGFAIIKLLPQAR